MKKSSYLLLLISLLTIQLLSMRSFAHPGWGIVVDRRGNIYFGDVNRNIVWKIDEKGIVTPFVKGKHSHVLHIDADGNIYGHHVEYDQRNDRWPSHHWMATPDGKVSIFEEERAAKIFDFLDAHGNKYLINSDAHKRRS